MKPGQTLQTVDAYKFGAKFLAPMPDIHIGGAIAQNGGREIKQTHALLAACQGANLFLDVGANIGWYSVLVPLKVGTATISIEPHPETAGILSQNLKLNGVAAQVVQRAASDVSGETVKMYEHPESLGGSQGWAKSGWPYVEAKTIRIDDLIQHDIDVGKIECQGFEVKTFRGLGTVKIKTLFVAYAPGMIRGAGDDPAEFRAWLEGRYSSIRRIDRHDGIVPWSWDQRFGRVESEFVDLICTEAK